MYKGSCLARISLNTERHEVEVVSRAITGPEESKVTNSFKLKNSMSLNIKKVTYGFDRVEGSVKVKRPENADSSSVKGRNSWFTNLVIEQKSACFRE